MLDTEDRDILLLWAIRIVACWLLLFGSAVSFGLALRVFDLVRG